MQKNEGSLVSENISASSKNRLVSSWGFPGLTISHEGSKSENCFFSQQESMVTYLALIRGHLDFKGDSSLEGQS